MRLTDIMTTPVETIGPGASAALARTAMKQRGVHHLAVTEGAQILGVLCAHDLRGAAAGGPIEELMSGEPVTAGPQTTVREAANLLRGRRVSCLPIVDHGRLVGMVTISDLLELIGRGVDKPIARSKRWTLKSRGPRKARPSQDRSRLEHTR